MLNLFKSVILAMYNLKQYGFKTASVCIKNGFTENDAEDVISRLKAKSYSKGFVFKIEDHPLKKIGKRDCRVIRVYKEA